MTESRLKTIEHWVTTAICAVAMSFAHTQPAVASARFHQPAAPLPETFLVARPSLPSQRLPARFVVEHHYPEAHLRSVSPGALSLLGFGRHQFPMASLTAGYRPVSGDARREAAPSDGAVTMRAGSIRDAVTRYNAERESGHTLPRAPNGEARPSDRTFYRN